MPNRILRDWTEDSIHERLSFIENQLKSFPKVKAGDPLQVIKWGFSCEKRRLRIRLLKIQGKSHTFKEEMDLIKSKNGECSFCGSKIKPSIDHIIPISKGGTDSIDNLQVLCSPCNSRKRDKI